MTVQKVDKYDLIVVGAGILGIAHAYHALKMKKRVAIIEKSFKPHQASVRNFGQIVPSGLSMEHQHLGIRSLECFTQIQRNVDITLRNYGSLYIASNREEVQLIEELHALNRRTGYSSQLWTPMECMRFNRGLRSSYVLGGLFFSSGTYHRPNSRN